MSEFPEQGCTCCACRVARGNGPRFMCGCEVCSEENARRHAENIDRERGHYAAVGKRHPYDVAVTKRRWWTRLWGMDGGEWR